MQTRRRTEGIEWAVGLLGVDSSADQGQVRRAFRAKVRSLHPDHGGDAAVDLADLVAAKDLLVAVAPPAPVVDDGPRDIGPEVVIDLREGVTVSRAPHLDRIVPVDRRGRLIDLAG